MDATVMEIAEEGGITLQEATRVLADAVRDTIPQVGSTLGTLLLYAVGAFLLYSWVSAPRTYQSNPKHSPKQKQQWWIIEVKGRYAGKIYTSRNKVRAAVGPYAEIVGNLVNVFAPKPKENPRAVEGSIPGTVEEIRYRRTGKYRGPYKHRFKNAARITAMRDGSLRIKGSKRMWGYY